MDKKKLRQFFQTEHIDELFDRSVVLKNGIPLPLEIEIGLVDACTRACKFCPRSNDEIAPRTSLRITPHLYRKIAKELKDLKFKGLVMISGYGESLLYPDVVDVVKTFNFTSVDITTNGDLLTRKMLADLKHAGINKILISVYEKEGMLRFHKLTAGFEDIVILRNRYEHFDRLYNNRAGALYQAPAIGTCYYPFYIMMVNANGDVFACCHEWQRRLKMGNLYQKSIWDIWTSEYYDKLRKDLLLKKRSYFPCRICNVDGTLRGEQNFKIYSERGVQ